jgi:hypothetical protein
MELMIFLALVIGVPLLIYNSKKKKKEAWQALPADGPMKVNITEENIPAGSFNSKRVKCLLRIDVKISQNDWKAIANAGLMKKVIFQYPSSAGDQYDPDNMFDFRVEHLKDPAGVTFGDVIQMQEAKEQLIQGLHNLKAQAEQQRGGPRTDSFEI